MLGGPNVNDTASLTTLLLILNLLLYKVNLFPTINKINNG